ncbi:MAG TPA: hypothetical protein VN445_12900 [Rectinemataceae bacterium]|nr:hypothetical protein [Rectinemataceae bacterium]
MLSLVFLASCATLSEYNPALPKVIIAKAEPGDFSRYGQSYESNPYLEPKTLLRGKLNEFFIAKLSFNLREESRISIIADAIALDGTKAATAYDQDGFRDYWTFVSGDSTEGKNFSKKMNTIAQTCVYSMQFTQKAGQNTMFLPMVGKNPIPRPATIYIQVSTGSGEPAVFKYTLE